MNDDLGLMVGSKLLRNIADLIEGEEPSVCNGMVAERPCWIRESSRGYFEVTIGILPQKKFLYDRHGVQLAELVS